MTREVMATPANRDGVPLEVSGPAPSLSQLLGGGRAAFDATIPVVSIVLRWPLLGVVVGTALGQRTRWRRDPALVRAYGRASWVWVFQYLIRLAAFIPLWNIGEVVGLTWAQVLLSWPLVAAVVAVSGVVLWRSLPPDHPGLRHPVMGERT